MHNRTFAVFVMMVTLLVASAAQDEPVSHRTYYENLTVDPDGHICYVEFLDGSDFDRIEYREEGRGTVSLYKKEDELVKYVETKDFNEDRKPDIITIEWTIDGTDIRRTTVYYGREYASHLVKHLRHALATAHRHIIRDKEVEKQRSTDIEARIAEIERRQIGEEEIGFFTTEKGFVPVAHKDLRYAFAAAGNLNLALSEIISGDYKVLSRSTELTKEYRLDIDILLSLDPGRLVP